jgi:hypothetical protein
MTQVHEYEATLRWLIVYALGSRISHPVERGWLPICTSKSNCDRMKLLGCECQESFLIVLGWQLVPVVSDTDVNPIAGNRLFH